MENKKKKRGIIIILVVIIVILLGIIGYLVYDKYFSKEEVIKEVEKIPTEEQENYNFYDLNNLVNSNYLKKIESTSMEAMKYNPDSDTLEPSEVLNIENGKVYVNFDQEFVASYIDGTPKYIYYSNDDGGEGKAIFVLTSENDLYYSLTYGEKSTFKKINTAKVIDIYTTKIDNVPFGCNMSGIFAYLENDSLIEIGFDGKFDFEKSCIYVDSIPRPNSSGINNLLITPDKELYIYNQNKNDYIKIEENNIMAKEGFACLDNSNGSLTFNNYIIDVNNILYRIDTYSSNSNYKVNKIKDINNYNISISDKYTGNITINFNDGKTENFNNCTISSLYYRNK